MVNKTVEYPCYRPNKLPPNRRRQSDVTCFFILAPDHIFRIGVVC